MAGLPPGWEWDYDGTRWFYIYKSTGHTQFHFPKEGDEFPDFVSAGAPAPQLAPEERLESQQQVRRRTSQHHGSGSGGNGDGERWRSRMSATGGPVSDIWQDGPSGSGGGDGKGEDREREAFQPENFMYLGPGTYIDVSPLMEEEDEAARRAVAGGSPEVGTITTTIEQGDKQEEAHMLDGREMPHELPVEERFNPVGVVAEMPSEITARSRAETHPDPVEIADNSVLAPIETAVPEGYAELPGRSSPIEKTEVREGGNTTQAQSLEERTIKDPGQTLQHQDAPRQESQRPKRPEEDRQSPGEEQPFKNTRESTNPGVQYRPYQPTDATENLTSVSSKRESWQPPARRDSSHLDAFSQGDAKDAGFDPSSVPAALALRKRSPEETSERGPPEASIIASDVAPSEAEHKTLGTMPSVLRPARNSPNRHSIHGSLQPPPQPPIIQAGATSLQIDAPAQKPPVGVTKFPSVLKPARGKAPAQPVNPEATQTPNEPLPRKSYLQPDNGSGSTPGDAGQRKYMSYTGRESGIAPISQIVPVETQQPVRPASVMPMMETVPQTTPLQQATTFEVQSDIIHRPASTPAGPSSAPIQHAVIVEASPAISPSLLPSVERTSNPSDGPSIPTSPVGTSSTATPSEVSPLQSRSASVSSSFPEHRRRGSSAVSLAQSIDSAATFTPSPDLPTPPSAAPGVGSPPVISSGLRHSVSGDRAAEAPEVTSPPVPGKIPLDQVRDSYFTAEDTESRSAARLQGSSNIVVSSSSIPAVQSTAQPDEIKQPQPQSAPPQPQEVIQSPPVQVSTPGHVLSRIEEHDEEPSAEDVKAQSSAMAKRHSLASSIQQSPQMGRQSPGAASVASTLSLSGSVAASRTAGAQGSRSVQQGVQSHGQEPQIHVSQAQMPYGQPPQGQLSQRQSPQAHGQPPQGHPPQGQPPQGQPPQGQPPQGQPPQGQPQQGQVPPAHLPPGQPSQGYSQPAQVPPGQPPLQGQQPTTPQAQQYPTPLHIPPGQEPMPGYPQQQWNTQMSPQVAPGFRPGSIPPPQSPVSPAKEEKKWTKWLSKGASKLSKSSTPPQTAQPQYHAPPPGQMQQPGMQGASGPPPQGWIPGPYGQPAVWQPGQPPQGHPNAGGQGQSMPPQLPQWQPPPGAPAPGVYAQPPGPPPTLQRTSTAGSGSTGGSIQPDNRSRVSIDSQHSQKSGPPLQQQGPPSTNIPGPPVQQQPQAMPAHPGPPTQQHRPQVHHQGPYQQIHGHPSQPQGPPPQQQRPSVQQQQWAPSQTQLQPVQQQYQPPASGYAYPVGYNVAVAAQQPLPNPSPHPVPGSQQIPATAGLPSQQSSQPPARTASNASLMPQPLFAKPVPGQPISQPQMDLSGQGDKWAKRPVADYSGGGWGDEDDWNR